MAQKIVVKKVKVGIPIKRVTSGAFAITNLGGVSTTGMQGGSLLIRDQGQQKFVVGTIVGAGGAGVSYDSANNRYSIDTQQFSAIDSSLIPSADSSFDLGSTTRKWRELYLSGNSLHMGSLTLKDSGGSFVVLDSDNLKAKIDLSSNNTGELSEGTNKYYTTARVDSAVKRQDLDMGGKKVLFGNLYSSEGDLPSASTYHGMFAHVHGTGKGYFAHGGQWHKLLDETSSTTANLTEGSNLYYTTARADSDAKNAISITDAGGDGSLSYNVGTGVITYTGPSASEVRAHLTANKGLSVSSGEFNIDSSNVKGMFSGGTGVTYNSGTGAISIGQAVGTGDNVSFQDVTVSSRLNVTDSSSFGGNLKVGGNLIVSGTSTVVNTETVTLADNIIVLNSNATGSATENGGIEIERGDDTNKTFIWDEGNDRWTLGSETLVAGTLIGNVTGNVTGTVSSIANHSTTNLSEGSNLYYTTTRSDSDFDARLATKTTANLSEGSNLYYTDARFDTRLGTKTTANLTEGSNLYYTSTRVDSDILNSSIDAQRTAPVYHKITVTVSGGKFLIDGTSQANMVLSPNIVYRFDQSDNTNGSHPLRFSTTSDGTHGGGSELSSNFKVYNKVGNAGDAGAYVDLAVEQDAGKLYYYCSSHSGMGGVTNTSPISSISVTDAGGDGSLAYNNSTGVLTYTGPSASEVRAHLTANKGLSVSSGEFNIDSANVRGMFSAGGDLSYNSGTGQFSFNVENVYTQANFESDLGAAIAGGTGITFDSGGDVISITNTGVSAGTYGSSTQVPQIKINAQGQVDSAKNITIAGVTGVDYDSSNGTITIQTTGGNFTDVMTLDPFTTANLSENTNLYHTTARARGSISVTDAGGDGSLAYNSTSGVITYTGPSASEVRAHLTANKGLSVSGGEFNIDSANVKAMFSGSSGVNYSNGAITADQGEIRAFLSATDGGGDGSFSYNNSTGVFTYTGPSASEVRAHLTANKGLSVSSGEFNIDSANVRGMFSATDAGGDGSFAYNSSNGTFTYTGPSASEVRAHLTANKGLSVSSGEFNIDSANVKAMFSGSSGVNYSNGAITADTSEIRGFFTANKGLSVSSGEFNIDSANVRGMFSGGTGVTYNSGTGAISLPQALATSDDVTFNDLTVSGNLNVSGTTTQTGSVVTDNNFTGLTNSNTGNSTDFGFYGKFVEGGTTKYAGIYYDASTDNTFRLFTDTQTVPSTTVNTGATGYSDANIIVKDITAEDLVLSGNLTVNGTTVTNSATNTTIEDALIELGSGLTGNNTNDLGLILERGNTGDNVFMGWDESQDRVVFATTTATGASTGDLTLTSANIQASRLFGDVTGALTGNASTATALATARSIALAGDVTASGVNFDGTGNISLTTVIDSDGINHLKTDDLPEGSSNLYHTTARARGAVSVTDAGGDGSLSYNSSNGVFTYTGPSASEVRAHLTANKGLSVSSGEFNIDSANVRGMFSGGTGITYNSGTGAITTTDGDIVHDNLSGFVANEHINHANVSINTGTGLTGGGTIASSRTFNVVGGKGIIANANDIQIDSANVLGMFSASGDLSYNSGTGAFSFSETYSTASELLTAIKTVDGSGSGLDADTLDGVSSASFVRSDTADTVSAELTFADNIKVNNTKDIVFLKNDGSDDGTKIERAGGNALRLKYTGNSLVFDALNNNEFQIRNANDSSSPPAFQVVPNNVSANTTASIGGNRILTVGDEGSGNGLDADTLDGEQGTHYRINVYDNGGTLLN